MAAEIRLFPCLTDNFGYLIHDPATKATASIDAPEAGQPFGTQAKEALSDKVFGKTVSVKETGKS